MSNSLFKQSNSWVAAQKQAASNTEKTWWVPLWRGLIVDQSGKHYSRISTALWLYLYLVLHANRRTGVLYRRIRTIAQETGFKTRTIQYWLARLRNSGYIVIKYSGRAMEIHIQKWKALRQKNGQSK